MCQYDPLCTVGRHRPGTICPRSGAGASRRIIFRGPSPLPRRTTAPSAPRSVARPATEPRYRSSVAASGLTGADLLAIIVIALTWDRYYEATGWIGVVIVLLLVLLPFAAAYWLTSTCTAWNGTVDGRCKKRRRGLRRCELAGHGRAAQPITLPEAVAVVCAIAGVVNVVIFVVRVL